MLEDEAGLVIELSAQVNVTLSPAVKLVDLTNVKL
jgi:hypothetical protein